MLTLNNNIPNRLLTPPMPPRHHRRYDSLACSSELCFLVKLRGRNCLLALKPGADQDECWTLW